MSRYGLFSFGTVNYGLPLLQLRKIIHQYSGYGLPLLPDTVSEVLVDEGRLIPLVALPGQGNTGDKVVGSAAYKVLAESEAGLIAFPAEVACGIVAEQKGELLTGGVNSSAGVAEVFKYQGKEYQILDIDFLALRMAQGSDKTA